MFADPTENLGHLSLRPKMRVADFGAGSGAYTLVVAKAIAPENGQVVAIDVQKDLLERLKTEAEKQSLTNIETVWADIEELKGTKLADDSFDAAIVSNVLFQAESKTGLVGEVKRILKPGGEALLIDWTDSFGGLGPQPGAVITEKEAEDLFAKHGFMVKERFVAGEHHYGFVLIKQ